MAPDERRQEAGRIVDVVFRRVGLPRNIVEPDILAGVSMVVGLLGLDAGCIVVGDNAAAVAVDDLSIVQGAIGVFAGHGGDLPGDIDMLDQRAVALAGDAVAVIVLTAV